ncbi:peptidoglycan DD-metalloendopeptidase family protein [Shewanella submarina]|uniref:Peptidoglycan DD-metalloendopeptidase family protein n=1 Tax=Shewanella submarina TaxID=2016376 RepID=A0ABV7GBK8_9GAMM|nr:peptidoglycan DD-metalloendopeptidase family protein [Shewanella submarina]MCL1036952.1 peptidoglycan DD-metalloendopeptidase family protein [Shewanella submarina]
MGKVITLFNLLPRLHQALIGLLLLIIFAAFLIPSEDAEASRHTEKTAVSTQAPQTDIQLPLAFRTPDGPQPALSGNSAEVRSNDNTTQENANTEPVEPAQPELTEDSFTVRDGDTLAAIFNRAGFSARDVYDVTQLKQTGKIVKKLMPGDSITLIKDSDGKFAGLRYQLSKIDTLVVSRNDDKLHEYTVTKEVTHEEKFVTAEITSNFWNAGVKAGLSAAQIMELATIFGWDVDFALDIREGDSFALLFDEEYADGKFLRNGNILAAEFINQGERFTAVRYTDGQYYSEEGRSMRKAFLKSPVDFKYVSSNFNPRRLHPVTGQVKAHRGVDYVAAVGTPIKAAGAGRVIKSSYNKYNGNYVFIKHNDTYTTKYLHLNKRKVKQGDNVKQGQTIGTLGATGRVTGAHLHYEFIVNGVHRNPRTVKLPKADPIAKKERAAFAKLSETLMAKIESEKQVQYARESNAQ